MSPKGLKLYAKDKVRDFCALGNVWITLVNQNFLIQMYLKKYFLL